MWTSSRTRLRRLEAAWHQPAVRSPYLSLVARYYDRVQHEPAYQRLPDQTWEDLNGDLLFGMLDATVSPVGQQCLYHRLRSPLADEVSLREFDAAATLLAQQPRARGQALLALDQLTADEAYYLADLLQGQPLRTLPGARCTPLLALGLLATLLGGFWLPVLWLGTGAFALTNGVFHFWQRSRIKNCVRPLLQLGRLRRAGQALQRAARPAQAAIADAGRAPGPARGACAASSVLSGGRQLAAARPAQDATAARRAGVCPLPGGRAAARARDSSGL